MAFTASLPVWLQGFSLPKSSSYQSLTHFPQFGRLGLVRSAVFRNGFSVQTPTVRSFASKKRTSGVAYAAATTEQSVYDFTVKVKTLHLLLT